LTNDLTKIKIGQAQYNLLLLPNGRTLDDLVVTRKSENELLICVNASNRKEDWEWLSKNLPKSLFFEDQTEETGLIALQGPESETILRAAGAPASISNLGFYEAMSIQLGLYDCYLSRTGYTGEDGFELYLSEDSLASVWTSLLEVGSQRGLIPVGLGARDTLRLEMGYPLHGHELSTELSPLEANVDWTIKWGKAEGFIGKEALEEEKKAGIKRKLIAFKVADRRIARAESPFVDGDRKKVGVITSGTFSPNLSLSIGLGFVEQSAVGRPLFVDLRGTLVGVESLPLPFIPSKTKSKKVLKPK
jgi:aminomethyltransferase